MLIINLLKNHSMKKKEMPFRLCNLSFLDETFALKEVQTMQVLDDWLERSVEITDFERSQLLYFRSLLDFNVHDWNEHELDSQFIGPMFALVNFSSYNFNHYAQRDLEGILEEWRLFGKPDGMIASGRRTPKTPYFAFQEYKKELDPHGDPAGQALAAMLVGQSLNEDKWPLYGCYVNGDVWRFMALNGKKYSISSGYIATTDAIFDIFRILKALKEMIIKLI